jgi:hypothetical protein
MVGELVAFWFDVFVSKLPGPLAMHIAAFTGLYIIVGYLGKPQCAVCGLGEALVGLALVERGSFDNKSTVVSFNLLLGTSGKNFSLSGGRHGNCILLSGMQYLRLAATIQQTHQSENNLQSRCEPSGANHSLKSVDRKILASHVPR